MLRDQRSIIPSRTTFDHMRHDRRLRDDVGEKEAGDRRQRRGRRQRRRGGFFLRAASSAGGTSARQRCARASPFEIRGAARILLGGLRSFLSRLSFHVRSFVGFVLVRSRPLPRTSRCKVAACRAARKGVSPAITTPSPRAETSSPNSPSCFFAPSSSCRLSSSAAACVRGTAATLFPDQLPITLSRGY